MRIIRYLIRQTSSNLKLIHLYIVLTTMIQLAEGCGSYINVKGGGSATITSGSNYQAYAHCLWWIETDSGYQLSMHIDLETDTNYQRCGDFIIIRNSMNESDIIYDKDCSVNLTNHQVTASASWMRVQFYSDGIQTTNGFTGRISSTFVGSSISHISTPIPECRSYEMKCSNKVCMTLSYRCDGFNDCGCDDDCDESGCEGLPLDKTTMMIIGGTVGFSLFLLFFIFAYCYESYLRKKALMNDPEAQAELQRKKKEKQKRDAYKKAAKEKKGRR